MWKCDTVGICVSASLRTGVGQVPRVPPTNPAPNTKPRRVMCGRGGGRKQHRCTRLLLSTPFVPPPRFHLFNLANTYCSYTTHWPHPLGLTHFSQSVFAYWLRHLLRFPASPHQNSQPSASLSAPIMPPVSWETIGRVTGS